MREIADTLLTLQESERLHGLRPRWPREFHEPRATARMPAPETVHPRDRGLMLTILIAIPIALALGLLAHSLSFAQVSARTAPQPMPNAMMAEAPAEMPVSRSVPVPRPN